MKQRGNFIEKDERKLAKVIAIKWGFCYNKGIEVGQSG
jgi:hypothetical protein